MEIYLVGGAVRDKLLGLPVKEKDWVVVGATPEEMLAQGFKPVGKEFPVFLHPKTKEEYALARTERKVGKGYKGFTFYASPEVTLADDLQRRDLTINAMAETADGELIDPYGGQQDLQHKLLHHVSPAFQEDPVRILRVARFSSQFPDFSVHPDTLQFMRNMVKAGEVNALVAERVWQELSRSLSNKKPSRFFQTLTEADALPILFPDISDKELVILDRAATMTTDAAIRFAALTHLHTEKNLQTLIQRYRIPNEFADLTFLVNRYRELYKNILSANAKELLNFITRTDALRRPERFQQFLIACEAIDTAISPTHQEKIKKALTAIKSVDSKSLQTKNLTGEAFAHELEKLRIAAIEQFM